MMLKSSAPVYGFTYQFKADTSIFILLMSPLGMTISYLGYWIGVKRSKT